MTNINKIGNFLEIILPKFKQPKGLKGESALCVEIANFLRAETVEDNLPFVWCHIPNQFSGTKQKLFGAILSWMGRIKGMPDYVFLGKKQCFCVEVKIDMGRLGQEQTIMKNWCESVGVPYYICRSLNDFKHIIKREIKNYD